MDRLTNDELFSTLKGLISIYFIIPTDGCKRRIKLYLNELDRRGL